MAKFLKLKTKADAAIAEGNTYEALQIFRTVRNRCKDASNAEECLNMLHNGAVLFGKKKEETTVLDIAEVYAETLNAFNVPPSEIVYKQIKKLFALLPATVSETSSESADLRTVFLNSVFKWSKSVSTKSFRKIRGDPRLHRDFADVLVAQGNNSTARLHYLLANDPDALSKFLITYNLNQNDRQDFVNVPDSDLYGAHAVLLLLTYKKLRVAQAFLAKYTRDHPDIRSDFPYKGRPLLNFVFLLLTVLSEQRYRHFGYLVEKYSGVISSDCEYRSYVNKIGHVFFNIPVQSSAGGFGLLNGLFKSLMPPATNPNEEYSSDEEMPQSATSRALHIWPEDSDEFLAQNEAADKVTAPGVLHEPQQQNTEEEEFQDAREEIPSPPKNVEMDLD